MRSFRSSLVACLIFAMVCVFSLPASAQVNPPVIDTIYSIVRHEGGTYLIAYRSDEVGKRAPLVVASLSHILTTDGSSSRSDYIKSIDFRPGTNRLYVLTNYRRLFDVNTVTGTTTFVATLDIVASTANSDQLYDMDFDPVDGSLRVITSIGLATNNYRVNPDTGVVTADEHLVYAPGEPNAGQRLSLSFAAYTPPDNGRTTLYGFSGGLYTIGSTSGSPLSPNSGQVFTVAPTVRGLCGPFVSFDISQFTGKAYVVQSCQSPGTKVHALFAVDLLNGDTTLVGEIDTSRQNTRPEYARSLDLIAVGADYQPGAGRLHFGSSTTGVSEQNQGLVRVVRVGNTSYSASVDYTTNANPPAGDSSMPAATPGEDFTPVSGTLVFPEGIVEQTFTIPLLNDERREPFMEAVYFSLSNPTGGAVLGSPITTKVIILDDDFVKFGFAGAAGNFKSQIFFENYGEAVVNVEIRSDETMPVNINYETSPETFKAATPGVDYTPVSGTLTFAPGERSKNIRIPLTKDDLVEGGERFNLTITDPLTGNSVLHAIYIRNYEQDLANLVLRQYMEGGREMLEIISNTDENFRSESPDGTIGGTLILPSVRMDRTAVRFQMPRHAFFRGESIFVTGSPVTTP